MRSRRVRRSAGAILGDGAVGPDGGATGATGATRIDGLHGIDGSGVFDSGPPAVIGGGTDAGDDGATGSGDDGGTTGACTGTAQPDGGCSTLADCPYACKTNVSGVACTGGACVITCNGENYDVNGVLSDGCEVAGQCVASQSTPKCPVDDHTQALAANAGSYPCDDGSSAQNMTGTVPSDYRTHVPAIDAFDMTTGAAPDYFSILGTGGTFCEDDANLTLTMTGTTQPACYVLTMLTDNNGGQTCTDVGGQRARSRTRPGATATDRPSTSGSRSPARAPRPTRPTTASSRSPATSESHRAAAPLNPEAVV